MVIAVKRLRVELGNGWALATAAWSRAASRT
jgi:hypothetical protein